MQLTCLWNEIKAKGGVMLPRYAGVDRKWTGVYYAETKMSDFQPFVTQLQCTCMPICKWTGGNSLGVGYLLYHYLQYTHL